MTLCFENFNNNEEIDNRMDKLVDDESNEYKSYSSDDGGERTMEVFSLDSLGEERNEEGNEERNKERNEEGNERRNSHFPTKGRCFW